MDMLPSVRPEPKGTLLDRPENSASGTLRRDAFWRQIQAWRDVDERTFLSGQLQMLHAELRCGPRDGPSWKSQPACPAEALGSRTPIHMGKPEAGRHCGVGRRCISTQFRSTAYYRAPAARHSPHPAISIRDE